MTPTQRLKAMRSNRGRTKPERQLASALWKAGYRFLTSDGYHSRFGERLNGNPDLIFTRKRVAIFFDGCFWHGCKKCHDFDRDLNRHWREKIANNVARDRRVTRELVCGGWTVVRVREHELKTEGALEAVVDRLKGVLNFNGEERD